MLVEVIGGLSVFAIILFILGFVFVGIEMVLPGFSFPGIMGIICLVAAVFLTADNVLQGAIITLIVLLILGMMLAIILWLFAKKKIKGSMILREELNTEKGYISSSDLNYLLGKEGIALTDLRPSGRASFDGVDFDVITKGVYIEAKSKIIISEVQGSKLIVKQKV